MSGYIDRFKEEVTRREWDRKKGKGKDGKYYPYKSLEGGAPTIGQGIKLNDNSSFTKKVLSGKGVTKEELDKEFDRRIMKLETGNKNYIIKRYGKYTYDNLPDEYKEVLLDYAYNTGSISVFPKLVEGLINNDKDIIHNEYKRYYKSGNKRKPLTTRNKEIIEKIESSDAYINNKYISRNPKNYVEPDNTPDVKEEDISDILNNNNPMNYVKNNRAKRYGGRTKMAAGGNYYGNVGIGSVDTGDVITRKNAKYSNSFTSALNKEQDWKATSTALGGAATGLSVGLGMAALGASTGSVLGPIGAAVGAVAGTLIGIFSAKKQKRLARDEEANRLEMERQMKAGALMDKAYTDIESLRNTDASQMAGVGFYAKYGGRHSRQKFVSGVRYQSPFGYYKPVDRGHDILSESLSEAQKNNSDSTYNKYTDDWNPYKGTGYKFKNTGTSVGATGAAINEISDVSRGLRVNDRNIKLNNTKIDFQNFGRSQIKDYTIREMEAMKTLIGNEFDRTLLKSQMEDMYNQIDEQKYNDFEALREQQTNRDQGVDFYARYGGRKRKATGGLVRNSKNTEIAYGATHEQFNHSTGTTGIPLGADGEVEGGGDVNGRLKAGEVIKYDTNGDAMVYSDKLKPKGTKKTYADIAKSITDKKGVLEEINNGLTYGIEGGLNQIVMNPANRLARGTSIRNIEKTGQAMNITQGMIAEQDMNLDTLHEDQEAQAYYKGLRQDESQMRYGGRKQYLTGGMVGMMAGGAALNFMTNIGSWLSNKYAIEREQAMTVPEISTIEAPKYRSRYNVTPELQALDSDVKSAEEYIKANTANPQIARANIASLSSRAAAVRGQIYNKKYEIEGQLQDRNIEARYNTYLQNTQIRDQNRLNRYNKNIDINSKRAANSQQLYQGLANSVGDAMNLATEIYGIDMYTQTHVSDSITKSMGWGRELGTKRGIKKAEEHRNLLGSKGVATKSSMIGYNPLDEIMQKYARRGLYRG